MAYEFSNSNESPKYTVVDILGRFFFSPDIQDRNLRTNHPTGLFHGHHLIPTNLFTKSELSAFWQKLVVQGYSQAVSLTNRAWLPATIEDALRLGSAKHSTNHAAYDLFIENKITEINNRALSAIAAGATENVANSQALKDVHGLQQWAKYALQAVDANGQPLELR